MNNPSPSSKHSYFSLSNVPTIAFIPMVILLIWFFALTRITSFPLSTFEMVFIIPIILVSAISFLVNIIRPSISNFREAIHFSLPSLVGFCFFSIIFLTFSAFSLDAFSTSPESLGFSFFIFIALILVSCVLTAGLSLSGWLGSRVNWIIKKRPK
jgi:hypothetical protein